jgi:hypothetical protein
LVTDGSTEIVEQRQRQTEKRRERERERRYELDPICENGTEAC